MTGLTTFTLARFDRRRMPGLVAGVPRERLRLGRLPGVAWGRHLGTSAGSGTLGADLARWGWLCTWDDDAAASRFHADLHERLRPAELATLTLRVLRARGRWGGDELPPAPEARSDSPGGPVVVLTRARVRVSRWRPFTAAVPPVDDDLGAATGRLRSVGVGEWPVLVQGTVSVWQDTGSMIAFARTEAHRRAVRRTADEGWYAEELFARFTLERAEGTWDGASPLEPPSRERRGDRR